MHKRKATSHGSGPAKFVKKSPQAQHSHMALSRSMPAAGRYSSVRREIKFCDIAETGSTIRIASTPPTAIVLNIPVQGAAPYNRVGSKVMNKSLRIRGYMINNATALSSVLRVIVFYDRQTNGTAPGWADLITAITSAGSASTNALDGINMTNRERFKILGDDQILTPNVTNSGGAGVLTNFACLDTSGPTCRFNYDRFFPLKNLETHYKASAGAVGDIATGGLFLMLVTDDADSAWEFNWTSRLRYDDL